MAYITSISSDYGCFRYSWIQVYGLQDTLSFSLFLVFLSSLWASFSGKVVSLWGRSGHLLQRREGIPTVLSCQLRFPAKYLVSLTRPESCACSWVGWAAQKTSGLSQKAQGKHAGQAQTKDFTAVIEISPEQQRAGGNLLLKRKDIVAIIPTNF